MWLASYPLHVQRCKSLARNHLTLDGPTPCNLQKVLIYMLNKSTPGMQKSEAKSEAPLSCIPIHAINSVKSVISDEGQGLSCL